MKTTILSISIAAAVITATGVHAQMNDATALQKAAVGLRFQVGDTGFRMVPKAVVQKSSKTSSSGASLAKSGAATTSSGVVGQVGPYAIVLPAASAAQGSTTMADKAKSTNLAVALNESSGQPVLVAPRLKLFVANASLVDKLAKQTGGRTAYASDIDGSGVINYPSLDSAQAALTKIKGAAGVNEVSLDIIQSFNEKN